MANLSTAPYKGVRDFYPEDMQIQNYIVDTMKKVCHKYGYQEYGASVLENSEIYRAKSGEEIVNEQTYTFVDRGEREVTLRPEMTPTIARLIAAKAKTLSWPVRWFSVPNLFRYERPQRGRLREHWQLNADIFGLNGVFAEIEIIALMYDLMLGFGAKPEMFSVKINNRRTVEDLFKNALKLNEEAAHKVMKLLDRKNKLPNEVFAGLLQEAVNGDSEKAMQIVEYCAMKNFEEVAKFTTVGLDEMKQLKETLADQGITNLVFDSTLMRGFDYYTGLVFEVFDNGSENNRSLFGGGRYDNLTGLFGVEGVSGCGFGMGDVTIRDFMETYGLLPKLSSGVDYWICIADGTATKFALKVAAKLRREGQRVGVDLSERKLKTQLQDADKKGMEKVIIIGEREAQSGAYVVKDMRSGEESQQQM
jgi:histidyl-tRNA synthetase